MVAIIGASKRRSGILEGVRPTREGHTATTFELFFDVVYVFAAIQVAGYIVRSHDALEVFQGLPKFEAATPSLPSHPRR